LDLDQSWIAKLRQLKAPVPIWGPQHDDVDLDAFDRVDAIHPRTGAPPSRVMPSAVKKAIAAARSSTTTLMWSNLLIVVSPVQQRGRVRGASTSANVELL